MLFKTLSYYWKIVKTVTRLKITQRRLDVYTFFYFKPKIRNKYQ